MRFVHVSDVHWGMLPDSDKPWAKDRAYDIKETFAKVISKTKELNADLLLISGDLFHRSPLIADLKEINSLFNTIPYTKIIIVAGANDRLRKNSNVLSFNFAKNVHYITSEDIESIYFQDLNVEIHAFSYYTQELKTRMIDNLNIKDDDKTHIVVAYGGDTTHMPIDLDKLTNQNISYYALGSVHKPTELVEKKIVYPGSLEPLDISEQGDRGIFIGDINTITKQVERVYFQPMSKLHYIALSVTVSKETTNEELSRTIVSEIRKRGDENIYRLRLIGKHDPETVFDFQNLTHLVRIVDIIDESEPEYNFAELTKNHAEDMIGFYIQALQKENPKEMSEIEKKALYYGINALLKTGEVKL
ncbi:MAG: metallophosphoesterase [Eubacteriales bacterium]|nr:metallophosphoesterase [Eubacteriales bacterium]